MHRGLEIKDDKQKNETSKNHMNCNFNSPKKKGEKIKDFFLFCQQQMLMRTNILSA